MRNDDTERLLFELPPDIFSYFAVIVNKQDAHLT
jgi:hypothetical protein